MSNFIHSDPDFSEYIRRAVQEAQSNPKKPQPTPIYLVTTPDVINVKKFDNEKDLIEELRKLRLEESKTPHHTRVVILKGEQYFLSKGEYKYLLCPGKSPIPLFSKPEELEPDPNGFLIDEDQAAIERMDSEYDIPSSKVQAKLNHNHDNDYESTLDEN